MTDAELVELKKLDYIKLFLILSGLVQSASR